MTRAKLPPRRPSLTRTVPHAGDNGSVTNLHITVGFENDKPSEVFCASFKSGSGMNALTGDACILVSRLLQHGDAPKEIAEALSSPPSVIGTIAKLVSEIE